MNTTVLFSELLVGGILSLTWIVLFAFGAVKEDSFSLFFGKGSITVGVVFLAYSYALGVVLDRVWDFITKPIDGKVRKAHDIGKEKVREWRREAFGDKDKIPEFIEYIRSRMRIARACLCNFVFISVAAVFYYKSVTEDPSLCVFITILSIGGMFSGIAFYAHWKLLNTYYIQLKNMAEPSR